MFASLKTLGGRMVGLKLPSVRSLTSDQLQGELAKLLFSDFASVWHSLHNGVGTSARRPMGQSSSGTGRRMPSNAALTGSTGSRTTWCSQKTDN